MPLGAAPRRGRAGVGRWMGSGARAYQPQPNREYRAAASGVRAWGLSSTSERGTTRTASQGPQVRAECRRMWGRPDSQEVGSEAATLERVRNSSLVEWPRADNHRG